eukprot:TRINITY_DN13075_c0_g1_i2.p1 TRINITY_DN13075_c0_g1~~TRINITY_DN13075_c0_g1_i2.p1  ORF type:complete len:705 (+),score=140.29 TRINITY_DN13075_c0_g1_i2:86-2200(+)
MQVPGPLLPGFKASTIYGLPKHGIAVFQDPPAKAEEFCVALGEILQAHPQGTVSFENVDVSKVPWPDVAFGMLLEVLSEKCASTARLKAYRCSLDDNAMRSMAHWIRQLPAGKLPGEIHLSHNNITDDGFITVFDAIEEKRKELTTKVFPVWLRAESNQVLPATIQKLADEGRLLFCPKAGDMLRMGNTAASVACPSIHMGANIPTILPASLASIAQAAGTKGVGKTLQPLRPLSLLPVARASVPLQQATLVRPLQGTALLGAVATSPAATSSAATSPAESAAAPAAAVGAASNGGSNTTEAKQSEASEKANESHGDDWWDKKNGSWSSSWSSWKDGSWKSSWQSGSGDGSNSNADWWDKKDEGDKWWGKGGGETSWTDAKPKEQEAEQPPAGGASPENGGPVEGKGATADGKGSAADGNVGTADGKGGTADGKNATGDGKGKPGEVDGKGGAKGPAPMPASTTGGCIPWVRPGGIAPGGLTPRGAKSGAGPRFVPGLRRPGGQQLVPVLSMTRPAGAQQRPQVLRPAPAAPTPATPATPRPLQLQQTVNRPVQPPQGQEAQQAPAAQAAQAEQGSSSAQEPEPKKLRTEEPNAAATESSASAVSSTVGATNAAVAAVGGLSGVDVATLLSAAVGGLSPESAAAYAAAISAAAAGMSIPMATSEAAVQEVLPPPWEKQWSEEYQIPYYWNPESGEALWEPPKPA